MSRKLLRSLLPEYANESLDPVRRWVVRRWLQQDVAARAELQALLHLRKALQSQAANFPSPNVWHRILAKVQTSTGFNVSPSNRHTFWRAWAGGMALVLLAFVLLWHLLPPGIVLQWTAQGGTPAVFRIYRAVSSPTTNFELIKEIDNAGNLAFQETRVFTYRDFLLIPGQEYIYRIEVIDRDGLTVSQTITSDTIGILPGQLALILALFVVAYGIRLAVQKPKFIPAHVG